MKRMPNASRKIAKRARGPASSPRRTRIARLNGTASREPHANQKPSAMELSLSWAAFT